MSEASLLDVDRPENGRHNGNHTADKNMTLQRHHTPVGKFNHKGRLYRVKQKREKNAKDREKSI